MIKRIKTKYYVIGEKEYKIREKQDGSVLINGKKADIKLGEKDGFIEITFGDKTHHAEIVERNQNKYTVIINGNTYNFSIETPISYNRKKLLKSKSGSSKLHNVEAPMPGTIIEIMVEEGEEVKVGDTLFVLEAMKMQNEILADISGKVKKLHFSNNTYVSKGDVIIDIEKN